MSHSSAKAFAQGATGVQGVTGPQGIQGATGVRGATGPLGQIMAAGTAIINFGSPPGANMASVAVTGQTNILASSTIYVFIMADTTVSGGLGHNAEEHKLVPLTLTSGNVIAQTGFTIYAESVDWRLTSTFQVRWMWMQ